MYNTLTNDQSIEHNDWLWLLQYSLHMYNYLGKDIDDPLLAFNNWEKVV